MRLSQKLVFTNDGEREFRLGSRMYIDSCGHPSYRPTRETPIGRKLWWIGVGLAKYFRVPTDLEMNGWCEDSRISMRTLRVVSTVPDKSAVIIIWEDPIGTLDAALDVT